MEILRYICNAIEILLFTYLAFSTVYFFIFSSAGLFYREKKNPPTIRHRKIAVLIPGYKEDAVIVSVAKQALNQSYPANSYDVIIIADSFNEKTLLELKKLPIKIVVVEFEASNKSRALNKCMSIIDDNYEIAVVLDADNVMAKDVLEKINAAFERGCMAVQGHRTAKNVNTYFAILDAMSEEINNNIFRKGHQVLGISAALIGSGMGIDYNLYKKTMAHIDSMGGCEDKEVELKIIRQNYTIEYLDNALIYDEKLQLSAAFVNQRRRWLACQIYHFKKHYLDAIKQLFKEGNFDYFDKVFQMITPPRILLIGTLIILTGFYLAAYLFFPLAIRSWFVPGFYFWLILLIVKILSLLFSIPGKFYNARLFKALLYVPQGFTLMIMSLLKIKGTNKKWLHTTHNYVDDQE